MARLSAPTAAPKKPQTKPVKTGFGGSAGSNTSAAVRESKSSNAPPATSRRASNKTSAKAIRNSSIPAKDYSSPVQVAIKLYEDSARDSDFARLSSARRTSRIQEAG